MKKQEIEKKFSNEENFYYGHGIGANNQAVVESIFKNGLRCSHEQLDFTTIPFGQGSPTLFEQNEEKMNNWEHKESKQIIVASLPSKFHHLDIVGTLLYGKRQAAFYQYISQEEATKLGINEGYYLKPQFIMGMYDANKKEFVSNEQYYENLPKEKQNKLMDEVKKQYIEILQQSGWNFLEYSQILEECNMENPLTQEEIEQTEKQLFDEKMIEIQLNKIAETARISDFDETTKTLKETVRENDKEFENEGWEIDDWE